MRQYEAIFAGVWLVATLCVDPLDVGAVQPAANTIKDITAVRCPDNPLITFASSPSLGQNINGPSVIRVPSWIAKPLGKYYMYFAHHNGRHIRLAYADALEGPWTIYEPGTLALEQAQAFQGHIASPDVHVDDERQEIRMYFHGPARSRPRQWTGVALAKDGLHFEASDELLGTFYFRVFRHEGFYYAISKDGNSGWGQLSRSPDGLSPFEVRGPFVRLMRHAAVLRRGNRLLVFHSRKGDAPERIVASTVTLDGDWNDWIESEPLDVIRPERDYEGTAYPNEPSEYGAAIEVQQLRDPCIFEEDGKTYLFYSIAGEMGIALAQLHIVMEPEEANTSTERVPGTQPPASVPLIRPSKDGTHFVRTDREQRFVAWGFNYDHDADGRLLEDYWLDEWPTVVEDFNEMKALGANTVRIHLQTGRFMETATEPNPISLRQLGRLVELAERTGLYLDITGLGCYHKQDVPSWYDALGESARWDVQARFWEAVAGTCGGSDAVFCYDLMNEPILPGAEKVETEWLAGEFAGKHFVQRIALDLAGRTRQEVAKAWVDKLVAAIRKHDNRHMVTVGVIPWVLTFPRAEPLFYSQTVSENLDFVSVHFYPKRGQVSQALKALSAYRIGKPLVIEETFPLNCSLQELNAFIEGSRYLADGYLSFYWGKTIDEYSQTGTDMTGILIGGWLKYFRDKTPEILDRAN